MKKVRIALCNSRTRLSYFDKNSEYILSVSRSGNLSVKLAFVKLKTLVSAR